jgi:nucleotide-binding universal stress UspA family protein
MSSDVFRVIVGVDGSPPSVEALAWGVTEARHRGGIVRVLTAWDYPAVVPGMEGVLDVSRLEDAARRAQSIALSRVAHDDVDVSTELVEGSAARMLIAASRAADLIVVGSRGPGGFAGLLLGSVSAQVVRHAECSVLVVRAHAPIG